jgi:uncharacterized OB-fold protein
MTGRVGLAHATVVRPAYMQGHIRVEGPDEDAFTLTVRALEVLEAGSHPNQNEPASSLHLVGPFSEDAVDEFRVALGMPELELERFPPTVEGSLQSLVRSSGAESEQLLATVDVTAGMATTHGSAAVAARFDSHGRVRVGQYHVLPRILQDKSADGTLGERLSRLVEPVAKEGGIVLVGGAGSEALGEWIHRASPGLKMTAWRAAADLGLAPATGPFLALRDVIAQLGEKGRGMLVMLGSEHAHALEIERIGEFRWTEDRRAATQPKSIPYPGVGATPTMGPGTVSEGAYVPRATYLRNLRSRWRLEADECGYCGAISFPARGVCRKCGRADRLTVRNLPRRDVKIAAITTIAPGAQPSEFDPQVEQRGAYSVAIVEPVEGVRLTTQLTDVGGETPRIGDRLDLELRRLYFTEGGWRYGLKAVPTSAT